MLSTIREKLQGWIAFAILFLVTIPFALWGINSYFEAAAKVYVAKVDGTKIADDIYQAALADQRRMLQATLGKKLDPALVESKEFKRQVVEGIILQHLLDQDADARGYRISDTQLRELIRGAKQFQRDGRFSSEAYQAALRNAGLTAVGFEERLRRQNMLEQVKNGFTESVIVTDAEVQQVLRLMEQKRDIAYLLIKPEQFIARATIAEADVAAYYEAHHDQFRTEEQFQIEYLRLAAADLAAKIRPDEGKLREAYAANSERYGTAEERRASHILIALAQDADAAAQKQAAATAATLAQQARGGDFAALARKHSADTGSAARGGDLGFFGRGAMDKAFEDAVFGLKSGEISNPVRTPFGYHVIKLTGIKGGTRKSFESVRADLAKEVGQKEAEARFAEAAETFSNLVYEHPDSLKSAADALKLEIQRSGWFSRGGGDALTGHPKVIAAITGDAVLKQGQNSEAVEIAPNTLVSVRVAGHRESQVRPLTEVRGEIERRLKLEYAVKAAAALGARLVQELQQGAAWEGIGAKHGLTTKSLGVVGRQGGSGAEAKVVRGAFRAAAPRDAKPVYGGVDLAGEGYAVFALKQVATGDPAKASADAVKQVRQALERRRGYDEFLSYQAGLRRSAEVMIYDDKL